MIRAVGSIEEEDALAFLGTTACAYTNVSFWQWCGIAAIMCRVGMPFLRIILRAFNLFTILCVVDLADNTVCA